MSRQQGSRRIKIAGLWMAVIPAFWWCLSAAFVSDPQYVRQLFILCLPVCVIGVVLMMVGWILEGYAE